MFGVGDPQRRAWVDDALVDGPTRKLELLAAVGAGRLEGLYRPVGGVVQVERVVLCGDPVLVTDLPRQRRGDPREVLGARGTGGALQAAHRVETGGDVPGVDRLAGPLHPQGQQFEPPACEVQDEVAAQCLARAVSAPASKTWVVGSEVFSAIE